MTVKKSYEIGDTVWVYGISSRNNNPTKGQIVKKFTIEFEGFNNEPHYLIAIPTEIEYLLEVRTWHNISQDEKGPVGSFRDAVKNASTKKFLTKTGISIFDDEEETEDDPTSEQILAALEKSQNNNQHGILVLETPKPKRRSYPRKKKRE